MLIITKNADPGNKYRYSGYGIGFDSRLEFLFIDVGMRKNVIIFGIDMSSSVHIDNKNKGILILGEGPTQGLCDTKLTSEAIDTINFTQPIKIFVLSLHYNGSNSFLNSIYQFKIKVCKIKDYALLKILQLIIWKKTELKVIVNFFLLILILLILLIF